MGEKNVEILGEQHRKFWQQEGEFAARRTAGSQDDSLG